MMERKLFNAPVAILAAVLGIVQSLIWIVCCILAVCVYESAIEYEYTSENLTQLDCFIEMFLTKHSDPFSFLVATPKTVNIFMYFYMVFSFAWLIQSCWVLKELFVDTIRDKMYSYTWIIFVSWAVVALILSLMDLVLMSLVSYDTAQYVQQFSDHVSSTIYNAMWFMILWSTRGFILLVANLILASFMLHFAMNIRKDIERCLLGGIIIQAYDQNTSNNSNLPWTTQSTINPLAASYDTSFENSLPRSDSFLALEKDNPARTPNEQHSFINSYRKRISNNRIGGNPGILQRSNTITDSPDGPPSLVHSLPKTHSTSLPSFSKQNSVDSLYQIPGQRERSSPERRSPSPNYGKLAKIGNHGRNSPLTNVAPPKVPAFPPVIPPPDYTPPSSPRSILRPVLKAKSNNYY